MRWARTSAVEFASSNLVTSTLLPNHVHMGHVWRSSGFQQLRDR